MHGEYKVPGGKLVVIDFNIVNHTLDDVQLSGDFFLEPPQTIDLINQALTGLSTESSEQTIAAEVQAALPADAELFGFDAQAIAVVIRRALA